MGLLSRLIIGATVAAVADSIEQNSNQNSPYYANSPGCFVVCTNCAFTIDGGIQNCPRCGAPATPPQNLNMQPAPTPNMQPAPPQSLGFCGSCGAARTNPGPCAYCGK